MQQYKLEFINPRQPKKTRSEKSTNRETLKKSAHLKNDVASYRDGVAQLTRARSGCSFSDRTEKSGYGRKSLNFFMSCFFSAGRRTEYIASNRVHRMQFAQIHQKSVFINYFFSPTSDSDGSMRDVNLCIYFLYNRYLLSKMKMFIFKNK